MLAFKARAAHNMRVLLSHLLQHLFGFHLFFHLVCLLTGCRRCDITAVLLYVEHLMWSVCESPEALVHTHPYSAIAIIAGGSDWPYQIHSLCEQLLTVLVIVTAPLSLLYRSVCTVCWFHPILKALKGLKQTFFSSHISRENFVSRH